MTLKTKHQKGNDINKILWSEMGACFSITFLLLILHSLVIAGHPLAYWVTLKQHAALENIIIGAYVFLVVLITIVIFERWSCNGNPSVSLYLYLTKECDGKITVYKILYQFCGAIIAGALAMGLVNLTDHTDHINFLNDFTGFPIDSVSTFFGSGHSATHFITSNISIFLVEFFAAIGLCWSLLSKNIDKKIKLFSVLIYLFIAPAAVAPTGVLSFNSARAFGPVIFHDIQITLVWHQKLTIWNSELYTYPLFVIAPLLGVLSYYKLATKYEGKIEPGWRKLIGTKWDDPKSM